MKIACENAENFFVKNILIGIQGRWGLKGQLIVRIEPEIFVAELGADFSRVDSVPFNWIFSKIVKNYSKYNYGEFKCISSRYN